MRQETLTNNPRLKWVAETVLAPLLARLLPQIVAAQNKISFPPSIPFSSLYDGKPYCHALGVRAGNAVTGGLSSEDPKIVEAYWRLVDDMVFGKEWKRVGKENKR